MLSDDEMSTCSLPDDVTGVISASGPPSDKEDVCAISIATELGVIFLLVYNL